ncbi:endolytic transglycosylase MltG [Clostridium thermarum]|uniref:endolytic transglycosylase MltG n=1 Tax=Clostridium thermarum TaxID=1716543 RepID=UPI00111D3B99|nr:endolytic transglycosylase MltG [Clostridium thermarum]
MLKKLIKTIATIWIVVMVIIIGSRGYYISVINKPLKNIDATELKMTIKSGDTLNGVINRLNSQGNLKNSLLIRLYMKLNKVSFSVKQGDVVIPADATLAQMFDTLKNFQGLPTNVVRVMIPEGKNLEEIGKILEEKGVISYQDFVDTCLKYELPPYIKNNSKRKYALEGYLFPDTYDFTKVESGKDGRAIIKIMLNNFERKIGEVGLSLDEVDEIDKIVTLASIIEKEVKVEEERTLVSSVFANRLKIGMPLQSDPTVQYALGVHKEKLSLDDYKIDSPYNTYVVAGIPVGPISNPGKASIEAALNPEDTKYLYFCSRNDGTHEFNESFEKHNAAVLKYQSN